MSKFSYIQNKTLSYLKKTNVEREEYKFSASKPKDDEFLLTTEPLMKLDEREQHINTRNALLIDHTLLMPLSLRIKKITIFYVAIIIWIILMLSFDNRMKYFIYGCLTTFCIFITVISWFYYSSIHAIEYRNKLLEYYNNELIRIRTVTPCDNTRFISATHKRQGWLYLSEYYDQQSFKNTEMVLAYAILQNNRLNLYIIDDKLILKPRQSLDTFTSLLKKMKSSKKIALDVNEMQIELIPSDLSMGRVWNKKYPIKITSTNDSFCIIDVDAPASSFIDFSNANSEPFVVPSYHRVTPFLPNNNELYLFGVCAREKERWYYKIIQNCQLFKDEVSLNEHAKVSERSCFNTYIVDIMTKGRWLEEKLSYKTKNKSSNAVETNQTNLLMASSMFSLNVIFSRLFWDLWREKAWNARILARIQRSLDRIVLPSVLKFLKADDLKIGDTLPLIFSAETPVLDDDGGFWINCPIYYEGKFSLTIHTQIIADLYGRYMEKNKEENTISTEEKPLESPSSSSSCKTSFISKRPSVSESLPVFELPPVSNSVSDLTKVYKYEEEEEEEVKIVDDSNADRGSRFKQSVFKIFNEGTQAIKSTTNNFSKAFIKYASNHLESSNISLAVKLSLVKGTLTLYFPPPPTNRLWLGFRSMPVMEISTKPKIGNLSMNKLRPITQLIEKKLKDEFKDVLVIPSMVDLYLPFLSSTLPNHS